MNKQSLGGGGDLEAMDATVRQSVTTVTGFPAALRSETVKILSLAFPRRLWVLAVVAAPLCAALFLATTGVTQSEPLENLSQTDIVGTAMLGIDAATLVMIVLGAWSAGGEYASGMIHTSLVVTPRRSALFAAKILCVAAAAVLAGVAAAAAAFGAAQLILLGPGLAPLDAADPQLLRMIFGSVVMVPFYAVVAAASAFLVRSTGGAVICALALMFVPSLVSLFPEAWQRGLLPLLPGPALHSLSGTAAPADAEYFAPALAIVSLVCWTAVVLGGSITIFARRDA